MHTLRESLELHPLPHYCTARVPISRQIVSTQWGGFSNLELASIKAPVFIAVEDHDFVRLEHAVEVFRWIPNAELAVIPTPATSRYLRNNRE